MDDPRHRAQYPLAEQMLRVGWEVSVAPPIIKALDSELGGRSDVRAYSTCTPLKLKAIYDM
jgi:hypothetical protein